MAKKKMRFATWADAELAQREASKDVGVLEIALRELAFGNVQWLKGDMGVRSIGLCKLDAAHGGVVIIKNRKSVGARYLDDWANQIQTWPAPPSKREYEADYREWLDLRRLATSAKEEQRRVHEALSTRNSSCTMRAPASIVDQSVPSY